MEIGADESIEHAVGQLSSVGSTGTEHAFELKAQALQDGACS
jgi:hypothetical protein